ncbi:hypothetical protein P378_02965 [Desulforamulus profundi]|uniref:DUF1508 domain-containing protein n=1 Tax=Desulforamulus profundi TaxID=1383067 RepID=A0A2C6LLQ4_9FIRM|nr:YegP family protein [Desulforamulus profundi]PHJ39520.1 hypothetical protein P378_02965 [Desulforamulus profundi]
MLLSEDYKKPKFEIFKDSKGQFRFRLIAKNGEIIAQSEGYDTKQGCENGIQSVKENAPIAVIVDLTNGRIKGTVLVSQKVPGTSLNKRSLTLKG